MTIGMRKTRAQFGLRTMLLAVMWFALILAVCVQYQHAATRHRETIDSLQAAGLLPTAYFPAQPRPKPAVKCAVAGVCDAGSHPGVVVEKPATDAL